MQPGYGNQSASGQAWYDNQAPDGQTWYGSQDGYGSQSREDGRDPAGHQAGGGYGAAGWALPDAPGGTPGAAAGDRAAAAASWSISPWPRSRPASALG